MSPKYHLTYFDLTGLGEPIRMLFHYGGIDYTETRILRKDWPTVKPKIEPLHQLPILEYDGKIMHQSAAIARYLAKKVGLAGNDDFESYEIDAAVDTVNDFRVVVAQYYSEENSVRKKALKEILDKDKLPFYLGWLEGWAKNNNGYLANGKLSWADLYFVSVADYLSYFIGEELLTAEYPNLQKVRKNVHEAPGIKSWVAKRPKNTLLD